jgi:hypothetical protein
MCAHLCRSQGSPRQCSHPDILQLFKNLPFITHSHPTPQGARILPELPARCLWMLLTATLNSRPALTQHWLAFCRRSLMCCRPPSTPMWDARSWWVGQLPREAQRVGGGDATETHWLRFSPSTKGQGHCRPRTSRFAALETTPLDRPRLATNLACTLPIALCQSARRRLLETNSKGVALGLEVTFTGSAAAASRLAENLNTCCPMAAGCPDTSVCAAKALANVTSAWAGLDGCE